MAPTPDNEIVWGGKTGLKSKMGYHGSDWCWWWWCWVRYKGGRGRVRVVVWEWLCESGCIVFVVDCGVVGVYSYV